MFLGTVYTGSVSKGSSETSKHRISPLTACFCYKLFRAVESDMLQSSSLTTRGPVHLQSAFYGGALVSQQCSMLSLTCRNQTLHV